MNAQVNNQIINPAAGANLTPLENWVMGAACRHQTDPHAAYAAFFFATKTNVPAVLQAAFDCYLRDFKLFCEFEGKKYKVTGASQSQGVYLAEDLEAEQGFDLAVTPDKCGAWSWKSDIVEVPEVVLG
jgi:hypothetical protein